MTFIHELPEFTQLLDAVAAEGPLGSAALVEKDYWVTHALWALSRTGIKFWFKGGTSLSKGFQIINRFSEDLDLVVLPGSVTGLPAVTSWRSTTSTATQSREAYWAAIMPHLILPDITVSLAPDIDDTYCNPKFRAEYAGHHRAGLTAPGSVVTPWVLLEFAHGDLAHCAVAPSVRQPITSFLHEWLANRNELGGSNTLIDTRPASIDCVHPLVTLLEKLDAITKRYARSNGTFAAGSFARHYEDAARIILALEGGLLPQLTVDLPTLAKEMLDKRQIKKLVTATDVAFTLPDIALRDQVDAAYRALKSMFWVPQMPLEDAQDVIIRWLRDDPVGAAGAASA